jgi:hypothetical protein
MPKVSRESATQGGEFGPVTDRSDQLDGYTVNFTSFSEDLDGTPLIRKTTVRGVQSEGSPNPGGFSWRLTPKQDF